MSEIGTNKTLQQRQGETGRLPRAGLGCGHDISAGKNGWDRLNLNWSRDSIPYFVERTEERFYETEGRERHGISPSWVYPGSQHLLRTIP